MLSDLCSHWEFGSFGPKLTEEISGFNLRIVMTEQRYVSKVCNFSKLFYFVWNFGFFSPKFSPTFLDNLSRSYRTS